MKRKWIIGFLKLVGLAKFAVVPLRVACFEFHISICIHFFMSFREKPFQKVTMSYK